WYIEAGKRLGDGELLQQLPELKSIAQVEEIPFRRLPSHALVDKDWLDLVRTIHSIADRDKADGVVITHGTNTIEETAYFLNLVLKTNKPVVVVGSMRPSSAISADGVSQRRQCSESCRRSKFSRPGLPAGDERHDFQRPRRNQERNLPS